MHERAKKAPTVHMRCQWEDRLLFAQRVSCFTRSIAAGLAYHASRSTKVVPGPCGLHGERPPLRTKDNLVSLFPPRSVQVVCGLRIMLLEGAISPTIDAE
jgi:hypothetical protein